MPVTLNVSIDLGSDTMKVAYAFEYEGAVYYGKISKKGLPTEVAIPAVAYYDTQSKAWSYGYNISGRRSASYTTVVKIKSLINLLAPVPSGSGGRKQATAIRNRNGMFYNKGTNFPKFYFPVSRRILSDFNEMVSMDMTFDAAPATPKRICEEFFRYAAELVEERVSALRDKMRAEIEKKGGKGGDFTFARGIKLAVVYPSGAGKQVQAEIARLAEKAFGVAPDKTLSSTKALSIYARYRGKISSGDSALVFDMGETDISVARAYADNNGELIIDGADGHSAPCEIGGNDVDRAVSEYIESGVHGRETVGTPSFGQEGHIVESGLREKQYLLMKDIKKAKIFLSMPESTDIFPEGVPVNLVRDLCIPRNLTRGSFTACIGIGGKKAGVAGEIAAYILNELALEINVGVKKVIISGGLAETYGLLDYIKKAVGRNHPDVRIITFDDETAGSDGFSVGSYEDSTYAAAVGAAIVALKNIDVKTRLSLSYASWVYPRYREAWENEYYRHKTLKIIADKGSVVEGETVFTMGCSLGLSNGTVEATEGDEIYSLTVEKSRIGGIIRSRRELAGQHYNNNLFIEKSGDYVTAAERKWRANLEKYLGLKVVSGGRDSRILYYHNGIRVRLVNSEIIYREGVKVDKDGRALPIIMNDKPENEGIAAAVNYLINGRWSGVKVVPAKEIELRFEGMEEFDIAGE